MAPAEDGLTYSFTTPDDVDDVLHFYEHEFVPREPMALGLGLTWDHERDCVTSVTNELCSCGASVIARDPAKDNRIVGIRLCKFVDKDSSKDFQKVVEQSTGKMRIYLEILLKLQDGFDPFEEEEDVDKILQYVSLGVAKNYSGRGIAGKMCKMSEERAKELGAQYVRVEATNLRSQKVFRRLGLEVRDSIDYATYEVDGEKVFDVSKMGESTCIQSMTKKL
ncbi:arylalkylamine N-acetyltransferase 1-like [Oratosquilla oratoria]|uniref:arylalkylamine N-acetyltransferase 1-like n=1 Tax=Oratosquilla oratoria TaxID=337810 RepID=UPI003F77343D